MRMERLVNTGATYWHAGSLCSVRSAQGLRRGEAVHEAWAVESASIAPSGTASI